MDEFGSPSYNGRMGILIDGYNLLNATGVEGTGRGTELERARRGLLGFLADVLTDDELHSTTIVFDAQGAPPGLPDAHTFGGMTVLFARGYAEADDLLEELIATDHAPRQLTVVSSDHRLHRAARRRRATPIDSEVWIAQLETRSGRPRGGATTGKPAPSPGQTDSWLAEFADVDVEAIEQEIQDAADASTDTEVEEPVAKPEATPKPAPAKDDIDPADLDGLANPFPDDFGIELHQEQKRDGLDPWSPFPPDFGADLPDEGDSP